VGTGALTEGVKQLELETDHFHVVLRATMEKLYLYSLGLLVVVLN
jgi:hypothetical protein